MRGFKNAVTAVPVSTVEREWHPLTLDQLREHLREGWRLPKEGFVNTDIDGLHSNSFRHRDKRFERAVLWACTDEAATPKEQVLALSIANCRRKARCRRISCFICNQRYWLKRRRLMEKLDRGYGEDEISWCTIVIGHSQVGHSILQQMIAQFKRDFIRTMARFENVRWSGRLEIDYLDQSVIELKPEKMRTLLALNWQQCETPTLMPHCHIVVVHPGTRREVLDYHLRQTFPGSRRVELKRFHKGRPRDMSLDALTRYPLKPPLDKSFWVPQRTQNYPVPQPATVRYVIKIREVLDRLDRGSELEFDHL